MTRFVIKNGDLDMSLVLEMKQQTRLQEAAPCSAAETGCDKPWLCNSRHDGCGLPLNWDLASILNLEEESDPGPHRIN